MNRRRRQGLLIVAVVLLVAAGGWTAYRAWFTWGVSLKAAEAAVENREFDRASDELAKYLQVYPRDRDAHLLAARVARRRGDNLLAFEHARKYEQFGGNKERADLEFLLIQMEEGDLSGVSELVQSHIEQRGPETPLVAEAIAEGCLKVLTPELGTNVRFGENAVMLFGQARRATSVWLELRQGQADQVAGLVWRGRIQALSGDLPAGMADLNQALKLDPDSFDARLHLAFLIGMIDPQEAIRQFEILRARKPDSAQVLFALARRYRATGRFDEAQRILDQLIQANPKDSAALLERGLLAMERTEYTDAESFMKRALEASPETPEISFALSQCMEKRGETQKMKEYREQYERLDEQRNRKRAAQGIKH